MQRPIAKIYSEKLKEHDCTLNDLDLTNKIATVSCKYVRRRTDTEWREFGERIKSVFPADFVVNINVNK